MPSISSLSPSTVYTRGSTFTLTVTGAGFIPSSVVYWNNVPLMTTYVSSTQLNAQVPASDIACICSNWIYVSNPSPGGGATTGYVQVVALDPALGGISPISVVAGTGATTITINGSSFMTGATVLWNGKSRPTTYINSNQLQVQLSSTDVSKPKIGQLAVLNPAPGGLSLPATFNVTYRAKITILDLPANDLVWDPYVQRIYASLPSSYGSAGNTIAVLNPSNGQITGYYFAGSEPTMMGLSADAKYLYTGLNGAGLIQRLVLPNFAPDIQIHLGGSSPYGGLNNALDIQVSPGDPHTVAAAINSGCCYGGQLEFFTDTTLLPNSITYPSIRNMVFANASTVFGYDNNTLSEVSVNSSGGTLTQQWNGLLSGNGPIHYDAGLVYGSGGQVLDPQTGALMGTYDTGNNCCCCGSGQILPDSAVNRVFALGNTPFFNGFGITSYNLSHFTPVAVTNLNQLSGNVTGGYIRWGSNGLAFVLQSGCCGNTNAQVILVQSGAMVAPPRAPPAIPYPVHNPCRRLVQPMAAGISNWPSRAPGLFPVLR